MTNLDFHFASVGPDNSQKNWEKLEREIRKDFKNIGHSFKQDGIGANDSEVSGASSDNFGKVKWGNLNTYLI